MFPIVSPASVVYANDFADPPAIRLRNAPQHRDETMAILGAHMSMAGGYYKAVDAAKRAGCDCVQLFT